LAPAIQEGVTVLQYLTERLSRNNRSNGKMKPGDRKPGVGNSTQAPSSEDNCSEDRGRETGGRVADWDKDKGIESKCSGEEDRGTRNGDRGKDDTLRVDQSHKDLAL
jgi:hypothetical protein